jgi:hypothetical protein
MRLSGSLRTVLVLTSVFLCALLCSGCSSLPLPNSPDEGLFLIAYDIDESWQQGNIIVEQLTAKIDSVRTNFSRLITLKPGDSYIALALDPGPYMIRKITVHNRWHEDAQNTWEDVHDRRYSFYINDQTVFLFQAELFFTGRVDSDGYDLNIRNVPLEKRERIIEKLKKDHHWLAWQDHSRLNL